MGLIIGIIAAQFKFVYLVQVCMNVIYVFTFDFCLVALHIRNKEEIFKKNFL